MKRVLLTCSPRCQTLCMADPWGNSWWMHLTSWEHFLNRGQEPWSGSPNSAFKSSEFPCSHLSCSIALPQGNIWEHEIITQRIQHQRNGIRERESWPRIPLIGSKFESQVHFLTVWPQTGYFCPLHLKERGIIVSTSQDCYRIKWDCSNWSYC